VQQDTGWGPVPETVQRATISALDTRAVVTAWCVLAGAAVAFALLYPLAVSLIDRPTPLSAPAALLFVLILLAWIPTVLATRSAQPERGNSLLVRSLIAAAPVAMFAAGMQESSYGFLGFIAMILFIGIPVGVLLLIGLIVALVQHVRANTARATRTVHGLGLWILGIVSLTSAWLLLTLPRQARLAEEAHSAGSSLLVFLIILAGILVIARRR
jgi:tellurite resistance protein TehA-like permease